MAVEVNDLAKEHGSQWKHTNRVYKILEYNYIVFPLTFILTLYAVKHATHAGGYYLDIAEDGWFKSTIFHVTMMTVFLLLQMPPFGQFLGLCLPMRPNKFADKPRTRRLGTLHVCLVTKGTNVSTAVNSVRCWDNLSQRENPSVKFHVLLDSENSGELEQQLPSYVVVDKVPESFSVKKAKYKARAQEYFRLKYKFSKEDWVLHLDEESEMDDRALQTTLDFIERGTGELGMGTIYYTASNHWTNMLMSAAEVNRVAEDFGRFQLPLLLLRRPFLGWTHGSWLLINGAVENAIGWDTDNVCEDYWFGYHAARLGYKFDWLHGIFREQPPCTLQDLCKQRRRWFTGIFRFEQPLAGIALTFGILAGIGTLIYPGIGFLWQKPAVPSWFRDIMIFNDAAGLHVLVSASVLQDMSIMNQSLTSIILHVVVSVITQPVVNLVHIVLFFSVVLSPPRGFDVIKKA
ncbi:unnamed protein product [Penicillium salamii]|uniref:Glycosyltransferase 2-like domain-containing protein n=1 Tax=Penicillium salamii TaxID=1612424 RepID=A0A9W4ITJ8_9EURO|nr:unnamed protein product [Penicillium salamii]CAG8050692.1 unnamed protein product [Penicillium salamii]CAG8331785.1 unnamed protein product [Penicillium salamii]CAG8332065.1 unnamed protein product [Penicillium salamii]CAG8340609.1 unnamed protein product [Penicillium salamii]